MSTTAMPMLETLAVEVRLSVRAQVAPVPKVVRMQQRAWFVWVPPTPDHGAALAAVGDRDLSVREMSSELEARAWIARTAPSLRPGPHRIVEAILARFRTSHRRTPCRLRNRHSRDPGVAGPGVRREPGGVVRSTHAPVGRSTGARGFAEASPVALLCGDP